MVIGRFRNTYSGAGVPYWYPGPTPNGTPPLPIFSPLNVSTLITELPALSGFQAKPRSFAELTFPTPKVQTINKDIEFSYNIRKHVRGWYFWDNVDPCVMLLIINITLSENQTIGNLLSYITVQFLRPRSEVPGAESRMKPRAGDRRRNHRVVMQEKLEEVESVKAWLEGESRECKSLREKEGEASELKDVSGQKAVG